LLRIAQILVGVRQVLDFIVELFLHLRKLLCRESCKIDCFSLGQCSALHLGISPILCWPCPPAAAMIALNSEVQI
jgi:hypothetical protein